MRLLQLSLFMKFRYFDIYGLFNLLGGGLIPGLRVTNFTSINLNNLILAAVFALIRRPSGFKNGMYILVMR